MRVPAAFALLALSGCATGSEPDGDYDEISQILGAAFHGANGGGELGAFADVARIVHGDPFPGFLATGLGVVEGRHGEAIHRYAVVCTDDAGLVHAVCGPDADRAIAIAAWNADLKTADHPGRIHRGAMWRFVGLRDATAIVTGTTWLWYEAPGYDLFDTRDLSIEMDVAHRFIPRGAMTAEITMETGDARIVHGHIEMTPLEATITLDGTHTATVDLTPVLIR